MAFRAMPLGSGGSQMRRLRSEWLEQVAQCPQTCSAQPGILPNRGGYSAAGLKLWSTVLASLAATVTFWSCSPSFSWTKAIV